MLAREGERGRSRSGVLCGAMGEGPRSEGLAGNFWGGKLGWRRGGGGFGGFRWEGIAGFLKRQVRKAITAVESAREKGRRVGVWVPTSWGVLEVGGGADVQNAVFWQL